MFGTSRAYFLTYLDQASYEISHAHPPQIAKKTIHAPKCSKILSEGISKNRQKSLWWKVPTLHISNMAAEILAAILKICNLAAFHHRDFWRFLVIPSDSILEHFGA